MTQQPLEPGKEAGNLSIFEGPTVASLAKILGPAEEAEAEKVADIADGRSRGERRRAAQRSWQAPVEVSSG